jgi:NAD(P)-dependent dehydrogenase (short-subunit alcohol dehydrogenase family)
MACRVGYERAICRNPEGLAMAESQVVLVTGASQGIGAATARAFAAAGHRVVLAARNAEKLEAVRVGLGADGERCAGFACDVADPTAVDALFTRIAELHGRLDVVFNNAGTNVPTSLAGDVSWEDWRRVLSVNLDGAFLVASAAFRMMRAQQPQGGRIINNGSISAHAPRYGSAPYTASKHAVTGLTRSLSLDGRAFDIACGQIDIGNAASSMTAAMTAGVPQADGHLAPEPTIDVAHVADAVVRMAALPLDVNVQFMTIMATRMPFVGRG